MSDEPEYDLVELKPMREQLPQVQPQPSAQSIIDSLVIRWATIFVTLIVIPIMVTGVYHVGSKLETHDSALAVIESSQNNIQTTLNDIKSSQKELKDTMASIASNQNLDERNIAGLQQSDIDRRSMPERAPEPAPESQRLQHHASHSPQPPNILMAIGRALEGKRR